MTVQLLSAEEETSQDFELVTGNNQVYGRTAEKLVDQNVAHAQTNLRMVE